MPYFGCYFRRNYEGQDDGYDNHNEHEGVCAGLYVNGGSIVMEIRKYVKTDHSPIIGEAGSELYENNRNDCLVGS